jgi:hypothetical protein
MRKWNPVSKLGRVGENWTLAPDRDLTMREV